MDHTPQIIVDYELGSPQGAEALIRHANNLQAYYSGAVIIEVMAYGPGLKILLQANEHEHEVRRLVKAGVRFVACQNTMQRMNITSDEHITGITEAPSGLGHIVDRQLAGWAYLKA